MIKNESPITFEQLLEIVSWAIFTKKVKQNQVVTSNMKNKKIKGAAYGGFYIGSPGRDIYFMLPYLSEEQMKVCASKLADKWPSVPPKVNVQFAACVRFIYGQFEKQGLLKNEEAFALMKKRMPDWSLSRKFMNYLKGEFKERNNFYGLAIVFEMEGHRLGDEAVVRNDKKKFKEMEQAYNLSVEFAHKCNSYKQMFTPYYWCAQYFVKGRRKKMAIKYCKLAIQSANLYSNNYVPGGEVAYVDRFSKCIRYLRKNDKKWKSFYHTYKKTKNLTIKKSFEKALKKK